MIELHEIINGLDKAHLLIKDLNKSVDISGYQREIEGLELQVNDTNFWSNQERAKMIISQLNEMKKVVLNYNQLEKKVIELTEMVDFIKETGDVEFQVELENDFNLFQKDLEQFQISLLLSSTYDHGNAIIDIHPGAGGTESQDWAEMLFRMYQRYCEKQNWQIEVQDYLDGEVAGLKSVTFIVKGYNAYGMLKSEKGIHRLVRLSPFDSSNRRHTSFAGVTVIPEIPQSQLDDIIIDQNDIRIDTYRASGAGGQHINKTDSAIRITHLSTNIVVTCQSQRSQIQNREEAMKTLKSKLFDLKMAQKKEEESQIRGEQKDITWGSQIRSYVLHPYSLVKDARTGYESNNPKDVLDGKLQGFIDSYLKWQLGEV